MNLFKLFAIFAKIGVTTFGGGYAMLPILQKEIVDKYKLATEKELLEFNEFEAKNKICFTSKKYPYDNFIWMKKLVCLELGLIL